MLNTLPLTPAQERAAAVTGCCLSADESMRMYAHLAVDAYAVEDLEQSDLSDRGAIFTALIDSCYKARDDVLAERLCAIERDMY